MPKREFRTTQLELQKAGRITLRTSARLGDALENIMSDLTLYDGVRLQQVIEAVYLQGKKDGARAAFAEIDRSVAQAKKQVPYETPGRPRLL